MVAPGSSCMVNVSTSISAVTSTWSICGPKGRERADGLHRGKATLT